MKITSYGTTIGIMTRRGGGSYFCEEMAPTLTTASGDNRMSVVIVDEDNSIGTPSERCKTENQDGRDMSDSE